MTTPYVHDPVNDDRWMRLGDVPRNLRPLLADASYCDDVRERLLANIEIDADGCWLWQRFLHPDGYGKISIKKRMTSCHQVARLVFVGPWPWALQLDHLCRNRACCNPTHLEPVTLIENVRRGVPYRELKTHCPAGHAYAAHGYARPGGRGTNCRECHRVSNREYARRRRAFKAGRAEK